VGGSKPDGCRPVAEIPARQAIPTSSGSLEQSKSWIVSDVDGASGLTAKRAIGLLMGLSFSLTMREVDPIAPTIGQQRVWSRRRPCYVRLEAMDFRLLGPLEVRSRGRALPLGGPKQRAVLAMLLLQAGEVVSTDRLIDEL
jgi:hypothetical protein